MDIFEMVSDVVGETSNQAPIAVNRVSETEPVAPATVTFDGSRSADPDGRIVSYDWEFSDGVTKTGPVVERRLTEENVGRFEAFLLCTDNDGKTNDREIGRRLLQVQPPEPNNPPNAVANVTPTSGEAPFTAVFDASESSDPNGNIQKYEWAFRNTGKIEGVQQSRTLTEDDVGEVTGICIVTDTDGASDRDSVRVTVKPPQNTPPSANLSVSPSSGEVPFTAVFDASNSSDPDGQVRSYEWSFNDGVEKTGAQVTRRFTADDIGDVAGLCVVTDDEGATDRDIVRVSVNEQPNEPPNAVVTTQVSSARQ